MPLPLPYLIARSREILHLSQKACASFLDSSERSLQRWEADRATPPANAIHRLADAVRSGDAAIAADLDLWAPRAPPPPPPSPPVVAPHEEVVVAPAPRVPSPVPPPVQAPPPPPPVPAHALVDSIVCAAAEAMSMMPQALRPALLAAFTRAHEVGIAAEEVVAVLLPPRTTSEAPSPSPAVIDEKA